MAEGEDKVTSLLTRKVGPLPIGVWIIAVGGGIGIAVYMRRNGGGGVDPGVTGVEDQGIGEQGGNTSTPPGVGGGLGNNIAPLPSAPTTNDEWLQRAADHLVGKGLSGSQVAYSLSRWLEGESLSAQDRAIVDMAIAAVGNPPVSPPPAANKPPDPPTVPPRHIPPMPGTPGKKPAKPAPPVAPHLVSQSKSSATLGVTHIDRATGYKWMLNGSLYNSTAMNTITITNLHKGQKYTVAVQGVNASGTSDWSRGFTFTKS